MFFRHFVNILHVFFLVLVSCSYLQKLFTAYMYTLLATSLTNLSVFKVCKCSSILLQLWEEGGGGVMRALTPSSCPQVFSQICYFLHICTNALVLSSTGNFMTIGQPHTHYIFLSHLHGLPCIYWAGGGGGGELFLPEFPPNFINTPLKTF
jgi:hypothetical protein